MNSILNPTPTQAKRMLAFSRAVRHDLSVALSGHFEAHVLAVLFLIICAGILALMVGFRKGAVVAVVALALFAPALLFGAAAGILGVVWPLVVAIVGIILVGRLVVGQRGEAAREEAQAKADEAAVMTMMRFGRRMASRADLEAEARWLARQKGELVGRAR